MSVPAEIPFPQLLDALLDAESPLKPTYLYRLSDLSKKELEQLTAIWPKIQLWRRQAMMEDIEVLAEGDNLLSFVELSTLATEDSDARVRLLATRSLWVYEQASLVPLFIRLLVDSNADVRAAAAGALGRFVYAGELEEIRQSILRDIEKRLLAIIEGEDLPPVRRSALEAMGYSSREEMIGLINSAFSSQDNKWVASAICAMGRSANPQWQPQVIQMLESSHPSLRTEAARAAGELELKAAVPLLLELLEDDDDNTRMASVWSLSQIGGEGVREALESLLETAYEDSADEQDLELLEQALDNLSFTEDLQLIPLFDFPEDQDEELEEELEDLDDLLDDEEDMDY